MIDCSVIIPHYNQSKDLEACLSALKQQNADDFSYEIIVIDNGSDADVDPIRTRFGVHIEHLPSPKNPYFCRNLGIQKAKGKTLAFLDAKCIPHPSWLKEGLTMLTQNNADITAGVFDIDVLSSSTSSKVFPLLYLNTAKNIQHKYGLPAGNLFVRRELFTTLGLFKTTSISGNDIEWTQRAIKEGYIVNYASEAKVSYPGKSYQHLLVDIKKYGKGAVLTGQKGLSAFAHYLMPLRLKNLTFGIKSREIKVSGLELTQLWFMVWFAKIQFALGMVYGFWSKAFAK